MTLLLSLISVPALAQDSWPAGALIEEAVSIQVTDDGLDGLGALIPGLIPGDIPIDDVGDKYDDWTCLLGYEYSLKGAWVEITFKDVDLVPDYGVLTLKGAFDVQINDPWDRFDLYIELACLGDTCHGYVSPFEVNFEADIALEVVNDAGGNASLDATIGQFVIDYQLTESDINLEDCAIGDLEDILNLFGISIYTLILDALAPELESAVNDLGPELEATIEEVFNDLTIAEEIEVGDAVVDLLLQPHDLILTPDGLDLIMEGSMSARTVDPCIAEWDPGSSPRTSTPVPSISELPSSAHMGMLASDDFTNQALYALWQGGLLCIEIGTADEELINTSLLTLLAGEAFDGITEDSAPMTIATRPMVPLKAVLDGPHAIDVAIEELGLDFYAEVDDRMGRVLGLDLDILAGVDLPFNGTTGEMLIELALGAENMDATVSANEISNWSDDELEAVVGGAFQIVLESFLGPLIGENLSFALPAIEGLGLTDLTVEAAGSENDWLAMIAEVGLVSYGADSSGCDEDGGCSGGGCEGGCASGTVQSRTFWLLILPLGLVGWRRRGSD
jgi:hypothetical protein